MNELVTKTQKVNALAILLDDVQNMSIGEKIQKKFQICKAEDNFIDEALFHTLADAKESFVTKKATFEKRREVLE